MRRRPRALLLTLALAACLAAPALGQRPSPTPSPGTSQEGPRRETVVTSLTLFAGTASGLMRSRNWGVDWERVVAPGLAGLGAARFVIPMGPRVYLGGDGGLFLSEDFGESWKRQYADAVALSGTPSRFPQVDASFFLGTPGGLLKSDDGGSSFRPTPVTGTPVYRVEWPGPALVVATGGGVRSSLDAGATFGEPGTGLPDGEVRAMALSSFYMVDPVLFAGVGSAGVFRSSDGGRGWVAAGLSGREVYDLAWLGPLLYAATDAGVFRSGELGASWTALTEGVGAQAVYRLLFPLMPASGAEAFVGTRQGLLWTGDGGTNWRPSGLAGETVLCLGTFPQMERPTGRKRR